MITATGRSRTAKTAKAVRSRRRTAQGRPAIKPTPVDVQPWIGQIDRLQNGFQLTQIQLATNLLNCAPRSLILWKKGHSPNPAVLIRLQELNRLHLALAKLMPAEEVGLWMKRTNEYLDPLTPLEVINRGQLDRLWQIIYNVGSGMPT